MATDEYTPVRRRARSTHGRRGTPAWRSYYAMLTRCCNENAPKYPSYGGRGIKVCERWLVGFDNFHEDMGDRPDGTTLDRKNNDGNYEPGNCRWATADQQSNNQRRSRFIDWNGRRLTVAQWSKITGINRGAIEVRIDLGWTVERTLTEPAELGKNQYLGKNLVEYDGRRQSLIDWSKEVGIGHWALQKRLQYGWDIGKALTQPLRAHKRKP